MQADLRTAAAEARARAAETAREAAEAGLAFLEDEMNEREDEHEDEQEAVATPRTMLTQAVDDFECDSQPMDPRRERQRRREGQMVRFAKNLEKRLHDLYGVPRSRESLQSKLQHARDHCGMPSELHRAADRVRYWRNISAHLDGRELPESDEQMLMVIRPIVDLMRSEKKRLRQAQAERERRGAFVSRRVIGEGTW